MQKNVKTNAAQGKKKIMKKLLFFLTSGISYLECEAFQSW